MREVLVLSVFLGTCALAVAGPDPAKINSFCKINLGYQAGTPEYAVCSRTLDALFMEIERSEAKEAKAVPTALALEVRIDHPSELEGIPRFNIQSREESITINNVRINRGNCRLLQPWAKITLKFGQRTWMVIPNCEPVEAEIYTDKGDYTVTFSGR
ncbi:MAG: hypothetical protein ACLPPF_23320 [Rhodomicrobium sp.]